MQRLDELHTEYPFYGSRQLVRHLRREGVIAGRHRIRRLMRRMGIGATYRRPRTSVASLEHRIFPYLLRGLEISRADQVWCADITYIPLTEGFFYLVAVMDWATRHLLSWRLSNTVDVSFCVEALDHALAHRTPGILNTVQGSQFTSEAFTGRVLGVGVRFSMDGRGRVYDNIFIERLWRSLKYEAVYLHELRDGLEYERIIGSWIDFYNEVRPHSALDRRTPADGLSCTGGGVVRRIHDGRTRRSATGAPVPSPGPVGNKPQRAAGGYISPWPARSVSGSVDSGSMRLHAARATQASTSITEGFGELRNPPKFALGLSKRVGPPQWLGRDHPKLKKPPCGYEEWPSILTELLIRHHTCDKEVIP